MRRDHVDPLLDLEARSIGIDDECRDSLGSRRAIRPLLSRCRSCEHAVEVGDAAVRNPGLGAVEHVVIPFTTRGALHGGYVRTRIGLRQGECRDRSTCRNLRQVTRSQRLGSGDRYRAAAEALHGEREVGQSVVLGERLAHQADSASIEVLRCAAVRLRYAATRESCSTEVGDEPPARLVDGLARFIVVIAQRSFRPCTHFGAEGAVAVVEERPGKMLHRYVYSNLRSPTAPARSMPPSIACLPRPPGPQYAGA